MASQRFRTGTIEPKPVIRRVAIIRPDSTKRSLLSHGVFGCVWPLNDHSVVPQLGRLQSMWPASETPERNGLRRGRRSGRPTECQSLREHGDCSVDHFGRFTIRREPAEPNAAHRGNNSEPGETMPRENGP